MPLHLGERGGTRAVVPRHGSSVEPVPQPEHPVPLRPELGPGPSQREIHIEDDGAQHPEHRPVSRRRTDARRRGGLTGGGSPCRPGSEEGAHGGTSWFPRDLIGVPRFELGASPTRTERATRLRHTPEARMVPVEQRRKLHRPACPTACPIDYRSGGEQVRLKTGSTVMHCFRKPAEDRARLRPERGGLFLCVRSERSDMANHLTPEELSKEVGIERDRGDPDLRRGARPDLPGQDRQDAVPGASGETLDVAAR